MFLNDIDQTICQTNIDFKLRIFFTFFFLLQNESTNKVAHGGIVIYNVNSFSSDLRKIKYNFKNEHFMKINNQIGWVSIGSGFPLCFDWDDGAQWWSNELNYDLANIYDAVKHFANKHADSTAVSFKIEL